MKFCKNYLDQIMRGYYRVLLKSYRRENVQKFLAVLSKNILKNKTKKKHSKEKDFRNSKGVKDLENE